MLKHAEPECRHDQVQHSLHDLRPADKDENNGQAMPGIVKGDDERTEREGVEPIKIAPIFPLARSHVK